MPESLYSPLEPSVFLSSQEKERALIRWIHATGIEPLGERLLCEIGCGTGDDLIQFTRLGFSAENLVGCDLLEERIAVARRRVAAPVRLVVGNALEVSLPEESFDVVFHSTVLSSLLDDDFQRSVAQRMWSLVRPGGGVLSCDFVYGNPRNPDVRGVTVSRIRELFPGRPVRTWRLGLAPPISRRVTKVHPRLYGAFNVVPFLRVYALCWIAK